MAGKIKVSVVVPVYNVELYIDNCLYSISNQTLKDIEIIIINDCSPDNSEAIIFSYSENDSRIRYFQNNKNLGLAETRNLGISYAKGDFIYFIDSDDYLELNSLERLYNQCQKKDLDILMGRYYKYIDNKLEIKPPRFIQLNSVLSGAEFLNTDPFLSFVAWDKFWKASFIKKHDLKFKNRLYEDVIFTMEALIHADRVMNLDFPFYHYIIRTNSITGEKVSEKHINDSISILYDFEQLCNKYSDKDVYDSVVRFFLIFIQSVYTTIRKVKDRNLKKVKRELVFDIYRRNKKKFLKAKKIGIIKKILLMVSPGLYYHLDNLAKNIRY